MARMECCNCRRGFTGSLEHARRCDRCGEPICPSCSADNIITRNYKVLNNHYCRDCYKEIIDEK